MTLEEDLSLQQLKNSNISSTTSKYADERFSIMGDGLSVTQLIESNYDPSKDVILAKFLTEATEKYPDGYEFQDVSPGNFDLNYDPSKTYEIWVLFYPIVATLKKNNLEQNVDGIKKALNACYVKIWSNSPSFHYQGFNYNLSQQNASLFPTSVKPTKWDKIHGNAYLDKHTYETLRNISQYFGDIAEKALQKMPKIEESVMKEALEKNTTAVFSVGRMNPYTKGHEKLIDKLIATALAVRGDAILFLTHTQDNKKNPLSWEEKVAFIEQANAGKKIVICKDPEVKSAFDAAVWLSSRGYTDIIAIFGSDRVAEMKKMYEKYNGVDSPRGKYDFKTIQVASAGDRDPDAEDITGFSATKARNAAVDNDFDTFYKIIGTTDTELAKQAFAQVRKGLLNEAAVGMGQELFNAVDSSAREVGLEPDSRPNHAPGPTKTKVIYRDPNNEREKIAPELADKISQKGIEASVGREGTTPVVEVDNDKATVLLKNKSFLVKDAKNEGNIETIHLKPISNAIAKTVEATGKPITIIVGRFRVHDVVSMESQGGPTSYKADFVLKNSKGEDIFWISHKAAPTIKGSAGFQQWGGLKSVGDSKEVRDFIEQLHLMNPFDEWPVNLSVWKPIHSTNLKLKGCYGEEYGGPFGVYNVNVIIQGMMHLETTGIPNEYIMKADHILSSGDVPTEGLTPVFFVRRDNTNKANQAGFLNCRAFIYPLAGCKSSAYIGDMLELVSDGMDLNSAKSMAIARRKQEFEELVASMG